jgi:hypothetical protein
MVLVALTAGSIDSDLIGKQALHGCAELVHGGRKIVAGMSEQLSDFDWRPTAVI